MRSKAFGLNLHTNLAVPGLEESPSCPADVEIHLGCMPGELRELEHQVELSEPHFVSPHLDLAGQPLLTVRILGGGAFFQFHYVDGTCFVVNCPGTRVWATWPDAATLADTATYLLGPIIGFILRLRGQVCLHASAVAIGDAVVAFLGPPGAGKSTTAAAFARRGFTVLSDDIVALAPGADGLLVHPAYPQLRLWPASVEMLYGDANALPPLTPNWDKRSLNLQRGSCSFPEEPLPLAVVYMLGERCADRFRPHVEPLPAQEALMTLVTHTYMNYLLDPAQRAAEFEVLGQLVATVPVRRVIPHEDPAQLPRLCDVLLADCKSQIASTHGG